ncbi:MAG: hypothetical protein RM347_017440 [Nostoc sp. ChiQUE02]|uniref:hypothetical protein n=1 Tax=Nostoc sp. ChiQUE02 TaxID=3075377 RepID=UPI003A10192A
MECHLLKQKLLPREWLGRLWQWKRSLAGTCSNVVNKRGRTASYTPLQKILIQIDEKGCKKKIKQHRIMVVSSIYV